MASEIRVNKINSQTGVGTITLSPTGVDISGITTVSTLKVGTGVTASEDGDIFFTGVCTATTFAGAHSGSGANLTNLPAANLSGTLPAISAANLTQIPAANIVGVCTSGLTKTGGFGAILQVVKTNVTASSSYGSSANSHYTLTPLNTTITPVGTNSHFIVSAQISGEPSANSNANVFIRLIRNTTSGFADGNNVAIAVGDNGSNNTAPENTSAFHGYYAQNNDSTISTTHITN